MMTRHSFTTSITPQHVVVNCSCGWMFIAGRKVSDKSRRMYEAMQRHRDAIALEVEGDKRVQLLQQAMAQDP
jgi:hypothetical protein